MPRLPEKLEIIVSAKDWNEAKDKLASVGIDEKTKITRRNINGLFMVMAQPQRKILTDEFYELIKEHKDISILTDTASWERNQEILDEIYKVEAELRKLLLHIYDLVEAFYEMFAKTQYAKKLANNKAITLPNHLDPITSRLMLGEMIEILDFDLSWAKHDISAENLVDLLQDVDDIAGFRSKIEEKMKAKRPWTIISEVVLSEPVLWDEVRPVLYELKEYRNKAAHFQVVTETEKEHAVASAKDIYSKITKQKPASSARVIELGIITEGFTRQLLDISASAQRSIDMLMPSSTMVTDMINSKHYNKTIEDALASINWPAVTALANATPTVFLSGDSNSSQKNDKRKNKSKDNKKSS